MAVEHLDSVTAESDPKRVSKPSRALRSGVCRRLPPIPTSAPAAVAGRRVLRLLGSLCHSGKRATLAVSCPEAGLAPNCEANASGFANAAGTAAAADAPAADAHALRTILDDATLWEAPSLGFPESTCERMVSVDDISQAVPPEICVTSPLSSPWSSEFSFGLVDWLGKDENQCCQDADAALHEAVLLSPGSSPRSSQMESDFGLAQWQLEEAATRKAGLPLLEHWQAQRWRAKADRMTNAALAVMERACSLACLEQSFRAWRCLKPPTHQSESHQSESD